jgi:predicted RNase H-like HicB family nuclease
MRAFTAVVERCPETKLYVGYVPGFPGAHSQGETLDELQRNLKEVVEMLLEDGEPKLDAEFVGTQSIAQWFRIILAEMSLPFSCGRSPNTSA